MTKIFSGLFLALVLLANASAQEKEVIVVSMHKDINGFALHMVIHRDNRVALRVEFRDSKLQSNDSQTLELLKKEVSDLTTSEKPVDIGNGFTFFFKGGFPIWGPGTLYTGGGTQFKELLFAKGATVVDKKISASGDRMIVGFYPYPAAMKYYEPMRHP